MKRSEEKKRGIHHKDAEDAEKRKTMFRISIHRLIASGALVCCVPLADSSACAFPADRPEESTKERGEFQSAIERGKSAVAEYEKLASQVRLLRFRLNNDELPAERAAAATELKSLVPRQQEYLQTALDAYKNAVRLATSEQGDIRDGFDEQETDAARLMICTLHYQSKDYTRAAELGEWIARNRSKSKVATEAARFAVAACVAQHREARVDPAPLEQLLAFATYLWKDRHDEQAVMGLLAEAIALDPAIAHRFTPRATELLREVVLNTNNKPHHDRFRVGEALQAVWQIELLVREPIDATAAGTHCPECEELTAELKSSAVELLTSAHDELAENMTNLFRRRFLKPADVSGILALVRLRLMTGQISEAQRILEHRVYGPLSLLRDNHKSISRNSPSSLEAAILWPATLVYWSTRQEEKLRAAMIQLEQADVFPINRASKE